MSIEAVRFMLQQIRQFLAERIKAIKRDFEKTVWKILTQGQKLANQHKLADIELHTHSSNA